MEERHGAFDLDAREEEDDDGTASPLSPDSDDSASSAGVLRYIALVKVPGLPLVDVSPKEARMTDKKGDYCGFGESAGVAWRGRLVRGAMAGAKLVKKP